MLNRYERESAERSMRPYIVETGSLIEGKLRAQSLLGEVIDSVEQMSFEEFAKHVNSPFSCVYSEGVCGLTSPDPANSAYKIDGYLSTKPGEGSLQAFPRAKAECLKSLKRHAEVLELIQE